MSALTHAQWEPFHQTDTAKEDAIPTLTSWTTSATLPAQVESSTELTLPVFHNAQPVIFLMDQSANCQSKHAHQDNSTMPKMEYVPHVLTHVQNANTLQDIVHLAHLDSLLLQTSALNQTAADQESSELLQDHVQHAHQSVLIVLVLLNVPHALQVMFTTELTAF